MGKGGRGAEQRDGEGENRSIFIVIFLAPAWGWQIEAVDMEKMAGQSLPSSYPLAIRFLSFCTAVAWSS